MCITSCVFMNMKNMGISWLKKQQQQNLSWAMWINMKHFYISLFYGMKHCFANNLKKKIYLSTGPCFKKTWLCCMGTKKVLTSLRIGTVWSAPLLFAYWNISIF